MLDALPTFQSMRRAHRVRKFCPRNAEHTGGAWWPGAHHRKTHSPTTFRTN